MIDRHGPRAFMRTLQQSPDLGRLLSVRIASQIGDGLFQAALGGAILFNPERGADPIAIAAGIAVLLLPYSLIGPFAGALLDRWDRRRILIGVNVGRAILVALVATTLLLGAPDSVVFCFALAVGGVSRFVASGLSAALPHVIERRYLVVVNSIVATIGAMSAAVGAGLAFGLRYFVGANDTGSAAVTYGGVIPIILAAFVAVGFATRALGPDADPNAPPPTHPSTVYAVATGLVHGARAALRQPSVAGVLTGLGAHRLVFGLNTLLSLLLTRHLFSDGTSGSGLREFSGILGLTAVGLFIAAVITPALVRKFGRRATVAGALAVAVVIQILVATLNFWALCVAALVLGVAGQVVKLSADAFMQMDIDDAHLGQVFAFQDALFNVAYVGAIASAALIIPDNGDSRLLPLIGAVIYAVGLAASLLVSRRRTDCLPQSALRSQL